MAMTSQAERRTEVSILFVSAKYKNHRYMRQEPVKLRHSRKTSYPTREKQGVNPSSPLAWIHRFAV